MLRISWVAKQLWASQEGLGSMELVKDQSFTYFDSFRFLYCI
jgi:hypothetical protein